MLRSPFLAPFQVCKPLMHFIVQFSTRPAIKGSFPMFAIITQWDRQCPQMKQKNAFAKLILCPVPYPYRSAFSIIISILVIATLPFNWQLVSTIVLDRVAGLDPMQINRFPMRGERSQNLELKN